MKQTNRLASWFLTWTLLCSLTFSSTAHAGLFGIKWKKAFDNIVFHSAKDFLEAADHEMTDLYGSSAHTLIRVGGKTDLAHPMAESPLFSSAVRNGDWKQVGAISMRDIEVIGKEAYGIVIKDVVPAWVEFQESLYEAETWVKVGTVMAKAGEEAFKATLRQIRESFTSCMDAAETGTFQSSMDVATGYCAMTFLHQLEETIEQLAKVKKMKRNAKKFVKQLKDGGAMYDVMNGIVSEVKPYVKAVTKTKKFVTSKLDKFRGGSHDVKEEELDMDGLFLETAFTPDDTHDTVLHYVQSKLDLASIRREQMAYQTSHDRIVSYANSRKEGCEQGFHLPILCDNLSYEGEDSFHPVRKFDYSNDTPGRPDAERKRFFHALLVYAFGAHYGESADSGANHTAQVRDYLNQLLFLAPEDLANDERLPLIVDDSVLGSAEGGFLSSADDGLILLNEAIFASNPDSMLNGDTPKLETDFSEPRLADVQGVYLQELGHWLNWKRCQYGQVTHGETLTGCLDYDAGNDESQYGHASVFGDAGDRFASALLLTHPPAGFEGMPLELSPEAPDLHGDTVNDIVSNMGSSDEETPAFGEDFNSVTAFLAALDGLNHALDARPHHVLMLDGHTAYFESARGFADIHGSLMKRGVSISVGAKLAFGSKIEGGYEVPNEVYGREHTAYLAASMVLPYKECDNGSCDIKAKTKVKFGDELIPAYIKIKVPGNGASAYGGFGVGSSFVFEFPHKVLDGEVKTVHSDTAFKFDTPIFAKAILTLPKTDTEKSTSLFKAESYTALAGLIEGIQVGWSGEFSVKWNARQSTAIATTLGIALVGGGGVGCAIGAYAQHACGFQLPEAYAYDGCWVGGKVGSALVALTTARTIDDKASVKVGHKLSFKIRGMELKHFKNFVKAMEGKGIPGTDKFNLYSYVGLDKTVNQKTWE